MEKLKVYRNYGCLEAEKRAVYTHSAPESTAVTYDEITVIVPDDFGISKNYMDQTLIETPDGMIYLFDDLLRGNRVLCIKYYDGVKMHYIGLKVCE